MNITSSADIMRHFLIRIAIAITVLAIGACLFACDRTDKKPASPPEKITIAVVQSYFPALIYIALQNNYFLDEGLDVTVQLHQTGVTALKALFEGTADLASTAETPIMFAITGGRRLTILAETFISDREMAIVARKDLGVLKPADLKGKRIAASKGTIREYFLYTYLGLNGISPKEVRIIGLASAEHMSALLSGKVQAVSSWNPQTTNLQKALGGKGVTFTMTPPHSIIAVLSSRPDLPFQKPEMVKGIIRALIRAENFFRANPNASMKIVADAAGMKQEQLRELLKPEDFRVSLGQSLLLSLEDESRWAIKNRLTKATTIPNYLDYIYFDGLKSVKPEAVMIIR
jgi:NitT/TauT family transport system substrate-binding protein